MGKLWNVAEGENPIKKHSWQQGSDKRNGKQHIKTKVGGTDSISVFCTGCYRLPALYSGSGGILGFRWSGFCGKRIIPSAVSHSASSDLAWFACGVSPSA
jgi:hypothetical protein